MNNNFVLFEAQKFAERLRKDVGDDAAKQIERAYQLALGRTPSEVERTKSIAFMQGNPTGLAELCRALFNLNEFVYRQ